MPAWITRALVSWLESEVVKDAVAWVFNKLRPKKTEPSPDTKPTEEENK